MLQPYLGVFMQYIAQYQGYIFTVIVTALVFTIFLYYKNLPYCKGRLLGKNTVKKLGKKIWEEVEKTHQNLKLHEKLEEFKKQITDYSLKHHLDSIQHKLELLNNTIQEKKRTLQDCLEIEKHEHEQIKQYPAKLVDHFKQAMSTVSEFTVKSSDIEDMKRLFERMLQIQIQEKNDVHQALDADIVNLQKQQKAIHGQYVARINSESFFIKNQLNGLHKVIGKFKEILIFLTLFCLEFVFFYQLISDSLRATFRVFPSYVAQSIFIAASVALPLLCVLFYALVFKVIENKKAVQILFALGNIIIFIYAINLILITRDVDAINTSSTFSHGVALLTFPIAYVKGYMEIKEKQSTSIANSCDFVIAPFEICFRCIGLTAGVIAQIFTLLHKGIAYFIYTQKINHEIRRFQQKKVLADQKLNNFIKLNIENINDRFAIDNVKSKSIEHLRKEKRSIKEILLNFTKNILTQLQKKQHVNQKMITKLEKMKSRLEHEKSKFIEGVHVSINNWHQW